MVIWIYLRVFAIPISGCLYLLQDCEHFQLLFYYVDFLCLFSSLLLLALPKFKHLFTCWCPMYHLYTLLFFPFSFFLYYFKRPIFKNRNYYFCVIWSIVESLNIIFIPFIILWFEDFVFVLFYDFNVCAEFLIQSINCLPDFSVLPICILLYLAMFPKGYYFKFLSGIL